MRELCKNPLYRLKSKKKLKELLYLNNLSTTEISNINNKRLVENPNETLKRIHKRVFKFIKLLPIPDYLISSRKGFCYIDNYKPHQYKKYIVTLDIEKFFPKCNAAFTYNFFYNILCMSPDVAFLITKLCTINLNDIKLSKEVENWLKKTNNNLYFPIPSCHIPTGSPLSQLLAFLSFQDMFEEISNYCSRNSIVMTLYVDDITLSSDKKIHKKHIFYIKSILNKYGHNLNYNKIKKYKPTHNKKITGVIINKNNKPKALSRLHYKVHIHSNEYKNTNSIDIRRKLLSEMNVINMIETNKYSNSIRLLKDNKYK